MNRIEESRYRDELSKIRVKCKCSHVLYFPSYGPDIKICNHCGKRVFRNDKVKFKTLLEEE